MSSKVDINFPSEKGAGSVAGSINFEASTCRIVVVVNQGGPRPIRQAFLAHVYLTDSNLHIIFTLELRKETSQGNMLLNCMEIIPEANDG